jgi:hypothetical protein
MKIDSSGPRRAASQRREGEVLMRLQADSVGLGDLCRDHRAHLLARYDLPGASQDSDCIMHLKVADTDAALQELRQDPRVAYAEPNYLLSSAGASPETPLPDDLGPELYGLRSLGAPEAWRVSTGNRQTGPVVAVLDSGCDYRHEDLAANLWVNPAEIPLNGLDDDGNGVVDDVHGFNAAARSGDPMDDGSHGTHVHGTIGAVGNNGRGVVGVNWEARLMPVKFLAGGYGDTADAIEGILYATKMGARITSNSWGGINYSKALEDVLASSPALHICAAGNDSFNNDVRPVYPAGYAIPNLVSVAASNAQGQLAGFSNFGADSVHVCAPGDKIYSTLPGNAYGFKSGTSMAAPHVSGVAALIAEEFPELSNQQIKDRLLFAVDRSPELQGKVFSGGHLNAAKALEHDTTPPAAPLQLTASRVTPFEVGLNWLAPGDDGEEGQASAYEIRFSYRPFLSQGDFQRASSVASPAPQRSGGAEELSLKIQPRGHQHTLYVGLQAVDNVGNRGALSQLAVTVPAAQVAFAGDAEAGPQQWTASGAWGLQEMAGRGPCWTDSPHGNYAEGANGSLTSAVFSLKDFQSARLSFECRYDLERTFDSVTLEASRDGEQWDRLDAYEGLIGWEPRSYDLSPYCGQELQLRFRLKTDLDVCQDGFYLDKLVVTGD